MKKQAKKLVLAKETVRGLDPSEWKGVAGGASDVCTSGCGETVFTACFCGTGTVRNCGVSEFC